MSGFYIVNKPKGFTSNDVCQKLLRALKLNKCGHNGTLDPNTTGVMLVGTNECTKLMKLVNEHDKEYICTMEFGYETDTLDLEGKVIHKLDTIPVISNNELDLMLDKLKEKTTQIPPIYSSIKVNGKKLYQYARENKEVEIPEREVHIYSASRISDIIDNKVSIKLSVSKGFYVRSFVRDLAHLLNSYATMIDLVRTKSGNFRIENSYSLEEIIDNKAILLSPSEIISDFEKLNVNDFLYKLVINGTVLDERQIKTDKTLLIYHDLKLIAVYENLGNYKYKPMAIFKGEQ